MPKISNGVHVYANSIRPASLVMGPSATRTKEAAWAHLINYWQNRPVSEQFDLDAAMWHGALVSPGDASIATFLKKLFGVMYLAGVMYNTDRRADQFAWSDAEPNNLPVASFLSHGGRVIIQLPVRTEYDDPGQAFFNWLTAEVAAAGLLITRSAATHALKHRSGPAIITMGERRYRIEEKRGGWTGARGFFKSAAENNHFGVNVALGGVGNLNPFSRQAVLADGAHGHLYMYYNPKGVGQCAGMMIGCENSAPKKDSQTYCPHNIMAYSERVSPCLTRKWTDLAVGPKPPKDAALVDLSDGWTWLRGLAENFTETELDFTPSPTMGVLRTSDPQRAVIYALTDVLAMTAVTGDRRKALEVHLKALLTTRGLTKQRLRGVLEECGRLLGFPVPNVNGAGSLTNPMPITMPASVQNTLATCRSGWALAA